MKWTDEAVRAALSQARAGRFSSMSAEEAMREILNRAWAAQSQTLPVAAAPDNFETFWAAYPCKKGKVMAQKAFAKVAKEFPAIMAGLESYRRNKPDYADWLHPATFLNQRRWEDEYDAPATGRTYDARRDGLALLLQESKRREADVRQGEVSGNVVQFLPRPDVECGGDEIEGGSLSVGAGPLF